MADIDSSDNSSSKKSFGLSDALNILKGRGSEVPLNQRAVPASPEALAQVPNQYIKPEDETSYPNSIPRNYLISKMGLPDTLKQSAADEIRYEHNLPMALGMTGGTVAPITAGVGTTAAKALANAAPSASGRLARVLKPPGGLGSVSIQEPLTYAQIIARNAMKAK